jgi:hypothetical protein
MDLVLTGDVFDLHRTTLWFKDNPDNARPYVASTEVSEVLESKVLDILAATTAEAEVSKTLEILRLLANSRYLETPEGSEQEFPATVTVYFTSPATTTAWRTPPPTSGKKSGDCWGWMAATWLWCSGLGRSGAARWWRPPATARMSWPWSR